MQRKQQGAEDAERRAQQQAWENAQRTDADARAQGLQMEEDQRQQQELARQERVLTIERTSCPIDFGCSYSQHFVPSAWMVHRADYRTFL
jgi:hypothetical protein